MAKQKAPNVRLRALLVEAGWAGEDLARAVNAVGAESCLTLRYDRTSIAHWLSGSRPPEHVCEFVAESLSRRLLRRVTVADTALSRRPADDSADPAAQGRAEKLPSYCCRPWPGCRLGPRKKKFFGRWSKVEARTVPEPLCSW